MQSIEELKQTIQKVEEQRSIIGEIAANTALEALHEKLQDLQNKELSPERKQVTVLFADVSGFTALSETLDHEEVMNLMNKLWQKLDQVILEYGGRIDKHIGDAVMALFGIPTAQENDPECAISAALAMQKKLKSYLQELPAPAPDLKIRIGLHTGLVSLGKVGTTEEYTAIGSVVNLACTIEQAAPEGEILISHPLYSHVIGVFELDTFEASNGEESLSSVPLYLVKAKKPRAFRMFSCKVEGILTPMVGREKEEKHLHSQFETMFEEQKLRLVSLVGEAGMGKSRLLHELVQWEDLQPKNCWFWKGRATQNEHHSAYFLIRTLFEFRFAIHEEESPSKAKEKLVQGVIWHAGEAGEKQAHFIGHLLGLDFENSPHLKGFLNDPKKIQQQAFKHSASFFQAMSQTGPLIFHLEDLHWADQGSLEWLAYLLKHCSSYPIFMVATYRPTFLKCHPSWEKKEDYHSHLFLNPLQEQDSKKLIHAILHKAVEIPAKLQQLIIEKSGGSPFFIEELIKMLVEERVILKTNEKRWDIDLTQLAQLKVPSTLTGVLQARFDSLNPQEKELLHSASVIGRVFWDQAVHFLREESLETESSFQTLRQKEMIFSRESSMFPGCQEYIFKHALFQEVVYESVLQATKRNCHEKMAMWMQEKKGGADVIAHHYQKAHKSEQAAHWYLKAGEQAKASYSLNESILFFESALSLFVELKTQPMEQMACHAGIGEIRRWQAHYNLAKRSFQFLLKLAKKNNNVLWQARAWNHFCEIHNYHGSFNEGLLTAEQVHRILKKANMTQTKEYAKSLRWRAIASYRLGKPLEKILEFLREGLSVYSELNDQQGQAAIHIYTGILHYTQGNWNDAELSMEQALKHYEPLNDQEGISHAFLILGELYRLQGDAGTALENYQKALDICLDYQLEGREILCYNNMAGAHLDQKDYVRTEEKIQFVLDRVSDHWNALTETYSFLALCHLGQGRWEESFDAAKKSLSLVQDNKNVESLGQAWLTLARVAMESSGPLSIDGKEYTALDCFEESYQVFHEAQMETYVAKTLCYWAVHEWQKGNSDQALAKWEDSKQRFENLKMPLFLERMKAWPPTEWLPSK